MNPEQGNLVLGLMLGFLFGVFASLVVYFAARLRRDRPTPQPRPPRVAASQPVAHRPVRVNPASGPVYRWPVDTPTRPIPRVLDDQQPTQVIRRVDGGAR